MSKTFNALRVAWLVAKPILVCALLGTLFSWMLFIAASRNIWFFGLHLAAEMGPAARAGAVALVFAALLAAPAIAVALLYLVGFPFLYFVVGKKIGIERGIQWLVQNQAGGFIEYVSAKAIGFLRPAFARVHGQVTGDAVKQLVASFLRRLEGVPWALRFLVRSLARKVDLADMAARSALNADGTLASEETLSGRLSESLKERLQNAARPSFAPLVVLVAVEIALFIACKSLLPSNM